jgi:hypothetical protein
MQAGILVCDRAGPGLGPDRGAIMRIERGIFVHDGNWKAYQRHMKQVRRREFIKAAVALLVTVGLVVLTIRW